MVDACVKALVAELKSEDFKGIIANERTGLENNYRAYLNAAALNNTPPQPVYDRIYIESRQMIEQAESLRRRCITMLQSFARALSALLKEMDNRATYNEFMDELY